MYNLLIASFDDAWDNGYFEFDRSRLLEYTQENLVNKFINNYDNLKLLPCLFGYEQYSKNFHVGYIRTIKNRDKKILIEFEIDKKINSIDAKIIKEKATLFDIRDWEINRTHWALKNEDLYERLFQAKLITKTFLSNLKSKQQQNKITNKNTNDKFVMSLSGYVKKIFDIKSEKDQTVFYRGHSKKDGYRLAPSLFRTDENGNYRYLPNESLIYREMIIANPSEFQGFTSTLDVLIKMQHYSLPTRLLDITSNPLIALYFACKSNAHIDGEVIIFKVKNNEIKYYDSDTVSCLANLARLQKDEQDEIDFSKSDFNKQLPIGRLVHFIKEEKPFFEPDIDPQDLQKVVCVKGKHNNSRITSQSGAFFLFGINAILDENGDDNILIERIAIKNKVKILEELDKLNINESTVFPYIETSAQFIAQKYEVKYTEDI